MSHLPWTSIIIITFEVKISYCDIYDFLLKFGREKIICHTYLLLVLKYIENIESSHRLGLTKMINFKK